MSTIYLHQMKDPYADCDFRNTEPEPEEVFDNTCPICGKSLDYDKVENMCLCENEVNHHFDGILAMVKPSHLK